MINITAINTVAKLNNAVSNADKLKREYNFKLSTITRQVSSVEGDTTDYTGQIATLQIDVIGLQAQREITTAGPDAARLDAAIAEKQRKLSSLQNHVDNYGPVAMVFKSLDVAIYSKRIVSMETHLTNLEAQRSTLAA